MWFKIRIKITNTIMYALTSQKEFDCYGMELTNKKGSPKASFL